MSRVTLAKSAGFCYGVERAVDLAEKAVEQGRAYLLGPVMQGRYLYPFICTLPVFFARPAAGEGRGDHRTKNKEELDHGI